MRKFITVLLMLYAVYSASGQTLKLEDTLNVTRDRWRDTCFGLINKSAAQIPSGYLIDYSLAGISYYNFISPIIAFIFSSNILFSLSYSAALFSFVFTLK